MIASLLQNLTIVCILATVLFLNFQILHFLCQEIECLPDSFLLTHFSYLFQENTFNHWLEEGRLNCHLHLKEIVLFHCGFVEAHLDLWLRLLQSFEESIDTYFLKDAFRLTVLYSLQGVNYSQR